VLTFLDEVPEDAALRELVRTLRADGSSSE